VEDMKQAIGIFCHGASIGEKKLKKFLLKRLNGHIFVKAFSSGDHTIHLLKRLNWHVIKKILFKKHLKNGA